MKIEIKSNPLERIIFSHEAKNNTIKLTVELAVKLGTSLNGANLPYAYLYEANLREARLRGANFYEADLRGANLSETNLRGANLCRANLCKADLSGANLYGAVLYGADFSLANLRDANLRGTYLRGANLCGANLSGVNLYGTNFNGANFNGANLSEVKYGAASISNNILQILGKPYDIYIFDYHIKIGCRLYLTVEWEDMTDDKIVKMGHDAINLWRKNKEFIIAAAKSHQLFWREIE